jgi:hypothetical protein
MPHGVALGAVSVASADAAHIYTVEWIGQLLERNAAGNCAIVLILGSPVTVYPAAVVDYLRTWHCCCCCCC